MRPRRPLLASLVTLTVTALALLPAAAWAVWPLDGRAICTAANNQWEPSIASDGAGGAFVVWYDLRVGGADIYGQHVDAAGNPLWVADGRLICGANNSQFSPEVIPDGSGGAIVVWSDQRSNVDFDIYIQRVNSAGTPQWLPATGVPVCTDAGSQTVPILIRDSTGGVFVVWEDRRNGVDQDIYCRYVNSSGVVQWAGAVPLCAQPGDQVEPQIVTDGGTRAVVTWYDIRGTDYDIYAQKINFLGSVAWVADGVAICKATGNQMAPTLVNDGGGALIAWHDYRAGGLNSDIYVRGIDVSGNLQAPVDGTPICTAAGEQRATRSVPVPGGAIVTWTDSRVSFGSSDIYAQRVDFSAQTKWATDGVPVCVAINSQNGLGAVTDGAGGAVMSWQDSRNGFTNYDIYVQRIDGQGNRVWTLDGIAMCLAIGHQSAPVIAPDEAGGVVVAWQDERGGGAKDIYAMRTEEGPVAVAERGVSIAPLTVTAVPNPFRGATEIRWELARRSDVRVEVFDVTGARVFLDEAAGVAAGRHATRWSARDAAGRRLASGVYSVRVTGAGEVRIGKAVLLR